MDEELETLREKSTRTSSIYDDLAEVESGEKNALSRLAASMTPQQKFILALLAFLDVIALVVLLLVASDLIGL